MIAEHDMVVLTTPVAEHSLEKGDVGTVVQIYRGGEAYEVEFLTLDGRTAALATLSADQVRHVGRRDLFHVRELEAA